MGAHVKKEANRCRVILVTYQWNQQLTSGVYSTSLFCDLKSMAETLFAIIADCAMGAVGTRMVVLAESISGGVFNG